jgi:N-methylhydantoinase B
MTTAATASAPATLPTRVDPVTFEILRHRLWSINEEAGHTLERVSGSLIASEVHDMNTSIMNARGDSLVLAPYMLVHAISMETLAKDVVANYQDNPGIRPGDMFLSNDPYVGAQHQMDVVVLGAIHWQGELIGWVGSTIHQIDLGGPIPGQVQVGAKDIYGEQPLFPPMKIVEGGVLRNDLVRLYLRMSRAAEMVRLDLTAMIAANNVATARVQELCDRYGGETVTAVMDDMLDVSEAKFRARLRELPDGTFRHRSYLEYEDKIYTGVLAMTKHDDRLTFDIRGSSKQAPAVINNPIHASLSDITCCVMTYLCWDIPWVPAGINRAINVESDPGTILHVAWPGGVSKATTSSTQTMINLADNALAKLLAASPEHRRRTMANWVGSLTTEELAGLDQRGDPFYAVALDTYFGGAGARSWKDGIDTGGYVGSILELAPNAEAYELQYPLLYLFRRHQPDSGGAGRFRGGTGCTLSYVIHDVERLPYKLPHASGAEQPESVGISGGGPSQTNQFVIKRNTDVRERFGSGEIPQDLATLSGELEPLSVISQTFMARDDVFQVQTQSGGGYGDPLERDPQRVLHDVLNGVVTVEGARAMYGVAISGDSVDEVATHTQREQMRARRRERARGVGALVGTGLQHIAQWEEAAAANSGGWP